jgi:hypothetical protein
MRYPLAQLQEEVAFIAYYLHWDHDAVMQMEHSDRRAWVTQVSTINQRINGN